MRAIDLYLSEKINDLSTKMGLPADMTNHSSFMSISPYNFGSLIPSENFNARIKFLIDVSFELRFCNEISIKIPLLEKFNLTEEEPNEED